MTEDEIIERVKVATTRYIEGSESSARGVYWTIHDNTNDDRWVASFQSRRERDEKLRDLNVRAAIAAHKAALAEAGFVIVPREPTEAMDAAAWDLPIVWGYLAGGGGEFPSDVWRVMIEAATKPQ